MLSLRHWTMDRQRAGYSVDSSKHPGHALQDDGQLKCDNTVVTL